MRIISKLTMFPVTCQRAKIFLFVFLFIINYLSYVKSQCGQDRQDKLALYKIILRTYWSRARFPRHYPEWRPPAQFGKLVGRTHDSTYSLYRLGERLTPGAIQYVETGRTDGLDTGGELSNIFDSFEGPAIPQGEGKSVTKAFLDGNHTLVSIVARINPSPDWFIGVDSFQLCVEDNWVDTVTVELDPLDGGTDNGFTFTAANWPTNPQGIVYRITSRYPAHPAGSFYYPNLARLPPIATLTFTKLKEYTLTETYHEDEVEMEFVSSEKLQTYSPNPRGIDPNRDLNEAIAEERKEMDTQRYRYWTTGSLEPTEVIDESRDNKAAIMNSIASTYSYSLSRPRLPLTSTPLPHLLANSQDNVKQQQQNQQEDFGIKKNLNIPNEIENIMKAQIYQGIKRQMANSIANDRLNNYNIWSNKNNINSNNNNSTMKDRQHKYRMKHHRFQSKGKRFRSRIPRDCKVDDWGAWSACSRSCGVGETQRIRKVIVKPKRGGIPCPPLRETKWCGSVNPCSNNV